MDQSLITLMQIAGPPVAATALCGISWLIWGRDEHEDSTIMPLYEPVSDLTVIESAVLLDDILQSKDLSYEIYDLFFKGIVSFDDENYMKLVHPLDSENVTTLPVTQQEILSLLFQDGVKTVRLDSGATQVKTEEIKEHIYKTLTEKGYYASTPSEQRIAWYLAGFILVVGGIGWNIVSFFIFLDRFSVTRGYTSTPFHIPAELIAGLVLAGLITGLFGKVMAAKTAAGVKKRKEILGFREFVMTAEKDRIEYFLKKDPAVYKKILPYAFMFGVKEKWLAPVRDLELKFIDDNLKKITFKMDADSFGDIFEENRNPIVALLNIIVFALTESLKLGLKILFRSRNRYGTHYLSDYDFSSDDMGTGKRDINRLKKYKALEDEYEKKLKQKKIDNAKT